MKKSVVVHKMAVALRTEKNKMAGVQSFYFLANFLWIFDNFYWCDNVFLLDFWMPRIEQVVSCATSAMFFFLGHPIYKKCSIVSTQGYGTNVGDKFHDEPRSFDPVPSLDSAPRVSSSHSSPSSPFSFSPLLAPPSQRSPPSPRLFILLQTNELFILFCGRTSIQSKLLQDGKTLLHSQTDSEFQKT